MIDLRCGDVLELMATIPSGSIDCILADLPYGSTALSWDKRIPLAPMWDAFRRVIKPKGAIVLFADFRFAVELYIAAPKGWFRYDMAWDKKRPVGMLNANRQPLRLHEIVMIFGEGQSQFNSQMSEGQPYRQSRSGKAGHYGKHVRMDGESSGDRFPTSIVRVAAPRSSHPTQKPLALMEYLVKTYTNEGQTVLDPTMGSGTCGHACVNTGRNFVGFERDPGYFAIAKERIEEAAKAPVVGEPPRVRRKENNAPMPLFGESD